jgi:NADH:ubiquinone oxidoreductase subunit
MFKSFKFINKLIAKDMKFIGQDVCDNKYYESPNGGGRICIYANKLCDVTNVPPLWFSWLHNMQKDFPKLDDESIMKSSKKWINHHVPNDTGSENSYAYTRSIKKAVLVGSGSILNDVKYSKWIPK